MRLALETGMRAGEILSLRWTHEHLQRHVAYLPDTKNGERRIVPLSRAAVQVLRSLPRQADEPRVIQGLYDTSALDAAFALASRDAGIEDFKFHDLRHEAASRMAPHMKPQEPAKVFGWKTLQMAMRYYNPREDELVAMVRRVEQARLLEQPMLADEPLPLAA